MNAKASHKPSTPPDPKFDDAVAAFRRVRSHVTHGRVLVMAEIEGDVTIGYEVGAGRSTASDVARFMSETPRGKR